MLDSDKLGPGSTDDTWRWLLLLRSSQAKVCLVTHLVVNDVGCHCVFPMVLLGLFIVILSLGGQIYRQS